MPPSDLEETTQPCPWCKAANFPFASFCISCGEPLDEGAGGRPDELSWGTTERPPHERTSRRLSLPRLGRRETVLGLLVLAMVVGYALFDWQQSTSRSQA